MKSEFEARTSLGALIKTFDTRKLAIAWWLERSCEFPGCRLEEVSTQTIVTRRTVRGARVVKTQTA